MNLFVTDKCPVKSAAHLDNKRVVKMAVETAQLLSSALSYYGAKAPYRPTHMGHPVTRWVRATRANYMWTVEHLSALTAAYRLRFGRPHKCESLLPLFIRELWAIPDGPLTSFINCTGDYRHVSDVHLAYQLYLNDKWETDETPPKWEARL